MKLTEFYKNEYVDQASYDNLRKISSLVDGQKNASRKILHTVLEKNIKEKIKVSQLNSKMAEFCLVGDTLVNTVDLGLITIKELVDKELDSFKVYCLDENGNETVGTGKHARYMKDTSELIEIETDTDTLRCTPDHKILVKRDKKSIWVEAQYLDIEDEIVCLK